MKPLYTSVPNTLFKRAMQEPMGNRVEEGAGWTLRQIRKPKGHIDLRKRKVEIHTTPKKQRNLERNHGAPNMFENGKTDTFFL